MIVEVELEQKPRDGIYLYLLFQHLVVSVLLLLNLVRIRQSAARDTRRPLLRHLWQVREVLMSWWRKL